MSKTTDGKWVLAGSERRALAGAVATEASDPDALIDVTLKLRRIAELPTEDLAAARPMTRDEIAASYGADKGDIAQVVTTFSGPDLTVKSINQATRTVIVSGSIAVMERVFAVRLFDYDHPRNPYRGRVGAVHLPQAVKDIVVGVFGLDNRPAVRSRRRRAHDAAAAPVSPAQSWYAPRELAIRYNFPPGDGQGQTIGLLEFGGGYFPADLTQFRGLAGVATAPSVVTVSVGGAATNSHDGQQAEVMLDVEVVAGACPGAAIVVYFAPWTEAGWLAALDAALQDAANEPGVLSISWGAAENTDIWSATAMAQIDETLKEAAARRITVCVATGDNGSSDGVVDGHAYVDFPSSSAFVLAVGGTSIPAKGAPGPDVVWKQGDGSQNDGGGSTGGGVSAVFSRPAWQAGVAIASVNPGAINGRCTPDLAVNADWTASPYLSVCDGQAKPNGGTSAACPLLASLITLINAERAGRGAPRVGYITPLLYQGPDGAPIGAKVCTDVVSGDNITAAVGGYRAAAGYDAASGWGAPNGVALLEALA